MSTAGQHNPWTILGQKEVYSNKWIQVTESDVLNPAGGAGIYGTVHFRNLAIGIIPMDGEGNTWLVGQYRFPLNAYSWEMPEGGGDLSTDPLDAAKRELLEETGLVANEWTLLMQMHLSNSVSDERAYIFLAKDLEQRTAMPEETEQLVVKKLPFAEAWHMVEEGVITDSMTVAGFQRVRIMQLEGRF